MENLKNTLLLTDKTVLKTAIVTVLLSKVVKNLTTNRDFYSDVFKFNSRKCDVEKTYSLNPEDLDPSVGAFLADVYTDLKMSYKDIFKKLNMTSTFNTEYIPLEVKFVKEYIKKYGKVFNAKNKITKQELLRPLK